MFDLIPFERRTGSLFDTIDHMMDENFFGDMSKQFAPCRTDIIDEGDKYLLKADLPGFNKDDIKIGIKGDELDITAERKEENSDKDNKGNYIRRERRYDSFYRSFSLDGIDAGKISASYTNGVLNLELPKIQETKPEVQTVEIK
ncbi:MAG TPA: hypothetical protein DG942_00505 [Ruminococcaceae bacterium]|jgi:HSP20 family protein|nr:hypothetical protein [Oscillospiraceae bacterium]